jgi:hypothetical protein
MAGKLCVCFATVHLRAKNFFPGYAQLKIATIAQVRDLLSKEKSGELLHRRTIL